MAIIDRTRPTTNKNVFIADGYRLLKLDTLENRSITDRILQKMAAQISGSGADTVVFSDFRHGIFNQATVKKLSEAIPEGVFKVADSQVASRWGNITEFQGFNLITPNEREARFALADQDSTVGPLAGKIIAATGCGTVMLKLGDRGVFCVFPDEQGKKTVAFSVDSFVSQVVDAVGAGDALLAYATLSLRKTGSPVIAAILGSMAAACECEYDGNIPVKAEDVLAKIDRVEKTTGYSA